jgi:MinD superfamily P-loop ATPase
MVIAVISGKGGTGKTLVSTALALSSGECVFVDLDVEEPNGSIFMKPSIVGGYDYCVPVPKINESICTYCGICGKSCEFNALSVLSEAKKTMFFSPLCHSCGVCSYVCPVEGALTEVDEKIGIIRTGWAGDGYGRLRFIEGRLNIGRPSAVPLIKGVVDAHIKSRPDELVIVDSPPGTSCPVVEVVKDCDFAVLVTEPTPFGLNDLRLAVELVQGIGKPCGIVLNKDNRKNSEQKDGIGSGENEPNIIDSFARENGIPVLMRIPYSLDIMEAYSKGIPVTEAVPVMKAEFKNTLEQVRGLL